MNSSSPPFPPLPWWESPAADIAARCVAIRESAHARARASIAAERPAAERPAAERPAAERPAAERPAAERSSVGATAHHVPASGYWIVRCRLGVGPTKLVEWGPPCPATVALVQTSVEPGRPDNSMERSSSWAAFVAGEPVPVWDLHRTADIAPRRIYRIVREIDEAEYHFLLAERAWARNFSPAELAAADPYKTIDLLAVDVPF